MFEPTQTTKVSTSTPKLFGKTTPPVWYRYATGLHPADISLEPTAGRWTAGLSGRPQRRATHHTTTLGTAVLPSGTDRHLASGQPFVGLGNSEFEKKNRPIFSMTCQKMNFHSLFVLFFCHFFCLLQLVGSYLRMPLQSLSLLMKMDHLLQLSKNWRSVVQV